MHANLPARLAAGACLLAACIAVQGQPYPSRPVTMVVPQAVGATID